MKGAPISDQTAIVTGAASGIGKAIAEKLCALGYRLVLGDKSESVRDVVECLNSKEGQATAVIGDVADPHHAHSLIAEAQRYGGACALVNNAGYLVQSPFTSLTISEWDRMIAVHLRGTFLCCAAAIPLMLARGGGTIVNMASQLGQKGGIELAHYSAAKAGIIGLTKSLALELSSKNIRVNAVAPGPINTPLTLEASKAWRDRKLDELPLGIFGDPSDVAETVAFLLSPAARLYVGQTLGPNSGDVML
ncbi:SDR family NAD(P)-dependent oxidoreductase [Bradyrhizobium sp. WSM3983]|uniref:SDR family NAD(P)-dependent oxidoreductase n=1 Tax=Bradyrhizobium sp. WSM3983 TaxID=1038867 RepID=UPI000404108C|nr:SDR family oxidoreductase [Bradyrhizobium sp. WSM3983]